ncbi:MAG TPA: efflux RND transporter periplasmic adaptor subunit [Candidatus Limnocylindrales bacterium]|nr:efflux RND transporter periplasmic adaptor subunit [Candidatus Limnocylindrales bacterium]
MKPLSYQKVRLLFSPLFLPLKGFGLLWIILIFLTACSRGDASGKSDQPRQRAAVPVTAATVVEKTVPIQIKTIGTAEAYSVVAVRAQVNGELTGVYFQEGQDVKKGDLLFTIDRRPLEAALRQAEANLAKDIARLKQAEANLAKTAAQAKNAQVQARRYESLNQQGIISKDQYDQIRTNAEALQAALHADQAAVEDAKAAIRADQAAIENVKLELEYCSIRSPLDGRTGDLMVHPGNLIKANDTVLVNINQISPIYVTFSVPEQELPEIKKYMAQGKLQVEAEIPNSEGNPVKGVVTFVDNAVDKATGTIQLKGTFDNEEKRLWPGQFVNVTLTLTTQPNAIVAPSQAIQAGQQGSYVFVIKPDLTVESRPVVVARTLENESIIEKGLQPGEKVVTDGQLRLTPGMKVEVKNDQGSNKEASS